MAAEHERAIATIAALKREVAKDRHFEESRLSEVSRLKAEVADAKCARDYERKALRETHASLTACESLLRAERAEVKDLTQRAAAVESLARDIAEALGLATFNPNYTSDLRMVPEAIANLRASALVVPEVAIKKCRLPWSFRSDSTTHYIDDADGFPVGRIDTSRMSVKEDSLLVAAIVKAANANGGK